MNVLTLALLLLPAVAFGKPNRAPLFGNCHSQGLLSDAKSQIPALVLLANRNPMGLPAVLPVAAYVNAADKGRTITSIEPARGKLGAHDSVRVGASFCIVNVRWSNGRVDHGYWYEEWFGSRGKTEFDAYFPYRKFPYACPPLLDQKACKRFLSGGWPAALGEQTGQ